jgi:hypothetical protein
MANVGRFLVEEKVVYFPLLKKAYNNNVSTAKVLPMGEDLGGAICIFSSAGGTYKTKTLRLRVFIGSKNFIGLDSKRASIGYCGFWMLSLLITV